MPATVLRLGIGSRGDVDHDGAVHLAGVSPSTRFGRPESAAPPCALFGSLTCGARSSERERERESENREISYFLDFE